jgi:transposase
MWTRETRGRMAELGRKMKRNPSDLTDEEWAQIEPLLPKLSKRGRKPTVDLCEVLNAIRYMVSGGSVPFSLLAEVRPAFRASSTTA